MASSTTLFPDDNDIVALSYSTAILLNIGPVLDEDQGAATKRITAA